MVSCNCSGLGRVTKCTKHASWPVFGVSEKQAGSELSIWCYLPPVPTLPQSPPLSLSHGKLLTNTTATNVIFAALPAGHLAARFLCELMFAILMKGGWKRSGREVLSLHLIVNRSSVTEVVRCVHNARNYASDETVKVFRHMYFRSSS